MRCGCSLLKALLSARKKVLSVVPFPLDRSVIGLHFNSVPFISVRRTHSQRKKLCISRVKPGGEEEDTSMRREY